MPVSSDITGPYFPTGLRQSSQNELAKKHSVFFFVCLGFFFFCLIDEGYYLFFGAVSQVSLAGLEVTAEVAWTLDLPVHTVSGLALQHALPLCVLTVPGLNPGPRAHGASPR